MVDTSRTGLARGARRGLGWALLALVAGGALVATAPAASAHPLGNFTVNTHLGVRVEPAAVALDVVVDIAEIPTMRAFPELDEGSGAEVAESAQRAYRERLCPALRDAAQVEVDGRAVELAVVSSSLSFPPGEAGLATGRLECELRTTAELDTVGHELVLTDSLAVQPVGWREITAVGDGVELASSNVPETSISEVLRSYPEDLRDTPLDQRQATLRIAEGTGVVTGAVSDTGGPTVTSPSGLDSLTTGFTDLVATTRLSVGFGILAVALAVLLGGLHAFAPGHGKTLMAAYLVGRNGSLRQAALIGVSVTLTHTVGVLVLGVLLSVAALTAPDQVYPWLGLVSGLLLVGIGTVLLRSGWLSRRPDGPAHGHGHGHRARDAAGWAPPIHGNVATRARRDEAPPGHEHPVATDTRSLLAVGFAGGLVPSPSALVVLLGGIALGRAWFGVLLVLAYGIGMALALVGTGLVLVRARGRIERWSAARTVSGRRGRGLLTVTRWLPVITAGLVVVIGLVLATQAVIRL